MDGVAIRVSDFLFNMGNTVFNVEDVEYRGSKDLDYEESNTLPINRVFYSLDEKVKLYESKTHLLMTMIFSFFLKLLSNIKSKNKVQQKTVSNSRKSYSSSSVTANSVISNNVRNRLLKTINEDINVGVKTNNNSNTKPVKLKNQLKSDIIQREEIDDTPYESSGLFSKLNVFVNRFM